MGDVYDERARQMYAEWQSGSPMSEFMERRIAAALRAADGARLEVLEAWKSEQEQILAAQRSLIALIALLPTPPQPRSDPVSAAREAVVQAAMKLHAVMRRPFDRDDEDFSDKKNDDIDVARLMLYSACAALAALESKP